MGKKYLGKRANHPPDGIPWIWHTIELFSSAAWLGRSINCRRLIDFLEIEHLRQGGNENGSLLAPYNQLVRFGLGRRLIAPAIREAEQRGLVKVERGGKKGTTMTELTRFTLTYHWTRIKSGGLWDWKEPTNNWQTFQKSDTVATGNGHAIGSPSCTGSVHLRALASVHLRALPPSQALEIARGDVVHQSEPPSISWGGGHLSTPDASYEPDRERTAAANTTQAARA